MLTDEVLKALLEGIIYIAPEPVTLDGIVKVLEGEERERVKAKLEELVADYEQNAHGIQIRQVANGYKFSTKAEHHEILRKYVKSLKPPVRLSKPALETLAVIAYRQPVTVPEIEEIRGVDSGGVIHTLLEKKLIVTSGRKSVVGRPILYRTSKDFLVHFGLKDVGELPSLKEFEELAKRALGSEWTGEPAPAPVADSVPAAGEAAAAPAEASGAIADARGREADLTTAEAASETPPETPPPVAAETAPLETQALTEAPPATTEEAGAAGLESALETPQQMPLPVIQGTTQAENPAAPEVAAGSTEESGAVSVGARVEFPAEAPPLVVEAITPIENPAAPEAPPAPAAEVGAAGIETPPVSPPEPEPVAAAAATNLEEPATELPPTDSTAPELPAETADVSAPATGERASAGESAAAPDEREPKH
jgi:segregation and condensation protein B